MFEKDRDKMIDLQGSRSLNKRWKYTFVALGLFMAAIALLLYRTLQLGREDATPAFLENLNPAGEMLGPEGIQFDALGNLYIGDAQGVVWALEGGSKPRTYAELDQVVQTGSEKLEGDIQAGGIAVDAAGDLYVAAYGFAGGSVLHVDSGTHLVRVFARDVGVANFVLLTGDGSHLWVSDFSSRGRLLRYPVAGPLPARADLVVEGLKYPNGLALGREGKTLYAAESYSGEIARIDLDSARPIPVRTIHLKGALAIGSLDGLAFDPRDRERRFLYVAENLRGIFSVVDLKMEPARVVKRYRLAQMGGRPCPASMVIRDGYLYFTDLWSCSPLRLLLRAPEYRQHAYRFHVTDLTSLY